ncbi:hypothetical protein YC2023_064551 [Brassica napus]
MDTFVKSSQECKKSLVLFLHKTMRKMMQGNELLKHFHRVEQHNNIFKSNIFKLLCCNLRFFQSIQHKFQGIEFMVVCLHVKIMLCDYVMENLRAIIINI